MAQENIYYEKIGELTEAEFAERLAVADAHCDTATVLGPWRLAFGSGESHLDIPRLLGRVRLQFMAFFLQRLPPEQAWRKLWQHVRDLRFAAALSGGAEILEEPAQAGRGAKPQLLLALEGLDLLAPDWQRAEQLYEMGIRSLGLFWNNDNFLGCGADAEGGCDTGLTAAGRQFVEYAAGRGFLIDLAHASERSFWAAAELMNKSLKPLLVSHACCRALCPHRRNLTDEQLRAVGASGGVVGITLAPGFLRADNTADIDDVVRHVAHAVEVAGPEGVALGSDFDGVGCLPAPMQGVQSWPLLAAALLKAGFSRCEVEAVMGGNLLRFCKNFAENG